ncbi:MAG: DNA polymerase III subunit delta [Patescibacteria group bacterium]
MVYLFLGEDDFSKKEEIKKTAQKESLEVVSFFDYDSEQEIKQATMNSTLFGGKKLICVYDFFKRGFDQGILEDIKNTTNSVVFLEEKLDKRKAETKKILANKNLKVVEFNIPTGAEFSSWVNNQAKKYDLRLSGKAMDLFLKRLGVSFNPSNYSEPLYDLWQADSELRKLKSFASDDVVSEKDILDLVSENTDDDIFRITNAIGEKDKVNVTKFLVEYMDKYAGSDEKSKIIGLSGLLSEQFRNILVFQKLLTQKVSDKEIANLTGYAPGRIFVYKKLATRFTEQKVLELLKKIELLDLEVKTTQGPASLQFFMIIESAMK